MATRRLVVNADDFGWSEAVSGGILQTHLAGIVTSTTLMANLPGAEAALERARREAPRLGLGLHLTLTEGGPLAPLREVGPLVDPQTGQFRRSLPALFIAASRSGRMQQAIAAEWSAQTAWAADHGLKVTHYDSHKHVHLHPAIWPVVIDLARRHGVRAVRTTTEIDLPDLRPLLPGHWSWSSRLAQRVRTGIARRWGRAAQLSARAAGLATTDWFFGVRVTGGLSAEIICRLLEHAPAGCGELMVHPGPLEDHPARPTRLGQSRPREMAAVCDPAVRAAVDAGGWRLISFEEV